MCTERNFWKMSHQKNEEEDCRKQKAPRGVSLWSVLIFLPLFSHLWQYIFSLIYLKLLSHMKTCFLNHCSPTVFFNLVHPCFPQLLSLVYHINCHWFSSNCFLTGFNHLLYFLITRSIEILIRASWQVLVKPKILVNRWSLFPPTILKVCLFLEISTTLMNLILKLYSKAAADWRLLQVIQRNLMNLKKSLWGSLAPAQVLSPPFTHVCSPPLSHHRTFCRSLTGRRCQLQHRGLDIFKPPSSRFLKPLWISPFSQLPVCGMQLSSFFTEIFLFWSFLFWV